MVSAGRLNPFVLYHCPYGTLAQPIRCHVTVTSEEAMISSLSPTITSWGTFKPNATTRRTIVSALFLLHVLKSSSESTILHNNQLIKQVAKPKLKALLHALHERADCATRTTWALVHNPVHKEYSKRVTDRCYRRAIKANDIGLIASNLCRGLRCDMVSAFHSAELIEAISCLIQTTGKVNRR